MRVCNPQRLLRASQFRRPSRQFCFRLLALGHVSQDHGEQFLATRFDLGDGSLDLKFFTIGSQCPKRAQCSHAAAGNSGFAEAANMPGVLRTEALWDEAFNGLPHRICGRAAEHLLCCRVEKQEPWWASALTVVS